LDRWLQDIQDTVAVFPLKTADDANSLGIPSLPALKLRQAYADAAGQGTVVWRLPGTKEVADEINDLFAQIHEFEKEIAH
jgi:hypothetical protein